MTNPLLAAVLSDPTDDTVRLAYADYLDENGEHDRAEFIRVQIDLARPGRWFLRLRLRRREAALFAASSRRGGWQHTFANRFHLSDISYRRGFADEIACHWTTWEARCLEIRATEPITRVRPKHISLSVKFHPAGIGKARQSLLANDQWPGITFVVPNSALTFRDGGFWALPSRAPTFS